MAKHIIQCRYCKAKFDTNELKLNEDYVMPSPRMYYHKSCYDKYMMGDEHYLADCYNYLTQEVGIKVDFTAMRRQYELFQKNYKCTPEGIYNALRYHYGVQKGSPEKSNNRIGIVPYVYAEAQEYFKTRDIQKLKINANMHKQLDKEKITLIVPRPEFKDKRRFIDLDSIEEGEDD